jgi:segregation and condensation protein B
MDLSGERPDQQAECDIPGGDTNGSATTDGAAPSNSPESGMAPATGACDGASADDAPSNDGSSIDGSAADASTADGPPRPTLAESAVRAATSDPAQAGGDEGSDTSETDAAPDKDSAAVEPCAATESPDAVDDSQPSPAASEPADDGAPAADPPPGSASEGESEPEDENTAAWRAVPLTTRVEALLFAAASPLPLRRLASLAGDVDAGDVRDAIASLSAHYDATARAFGIQEIGGGYQLRTNAELSSLLTRLGRKSTTEKLSPAAIETLAIVAYRQPVLRVDVEKIRGVASGEVLRTLIEKGMARVAGRADLPGSPLLYGTTPAFLEIFGLRDLRDLPSDRAMLRRPV